jgi:putative hydrolase of the HAD superfamily
MRAVVFDFFGTLTDPSAEALRLSSFGATAAALGVPAGDFTAAMSGTFPQRIVGAFGDTRATLRAMAERCGASPTSGQLDDAVAVQHAGAAAVRRPRPGVLAVLDRLRAAGLRLGLISDCSSELVEAWSTTEYAGRIDAPVFSWQEGHRKPDLRLYAAVGERLGVAPGDCWYVGDGGSREFQGALAAGMRPILVTNEDYPAAGAHRTDPDPVVPDLSVKDLLELPTLLGIPPQIGTKVQ